MLETVDTVQEVLNRATQAAAVFSQYDQEQTDSIVRAVYQAGFNNRVSLAKMAHEETGIGKWEDKVMKNVLASQLMYEDLKHVKTVGIISEDEKEGIIEIAQPLGPILAVTPVTNPTSTVIFKVMIALKTRNPIIISPHRKAAKCSIEAARICYEAALEAGAPDHCIQWVEHSSREQTNALMSDRRIALILATGGGGLVKAAYSSGNPALGVGAGNVPVFIEASADVPFAVEQILLSKTFDNGTVCCSEQSVVVERSIADRVKEEFKRRGGHFLSENEIKLLEKVALDPKTGNMSADIVGKAATVIAKMAGFEVPEGTVLLLAPLKGVGKEHPLSAEILAPILGFLVADDFHHAVNICIELNYFGGIGHSASMHSNDDEKIKEFASLMNAGRILVNVPSSHGGVGGFFTSLSPSLTLGCGTSGKNITTDNVTAKHLLNIQRVARRRLNVKVHNVQTGKYLDESVRADEMEKEYHRNH